MKKSFIPALTAIALAVPLGIGGLTVTASPAEANAIRHHFNTCSRDVIWKCHSKVQSPILFNTGYNRLFPSRAMPEGANGLDQKTFGTLDWQNRNRWGPGSGVYAALYLEEFFSDVDVRAFNESAAAGDRFAYSTPGYISPDDRARFEAHVAAVQERQAQEAARRAEEERRRAEEERRLAETGICSVDEIVYCESSVSVHVAGEYSSLFDGSADFDPGSNGADQATFEALAAQIGTADDDRRILILSYLRAVYPDPYQFSEHRSAYPYQARAFISPNDREAIEAIIAGELEADAAAERERRMREAEEAERRRMEAEERERVNRRKLVAFKRECEAQGEREITSYSLYSDFWKRNVCVVRRRAPGNNEAEDTYHFFPDMANLGLHFLGTGEVAFQITPIRPLGSIADIEDIIDHRQVTSENRGEIIELQEEVTDHEDRLAELEPVVTRNSQVVEALGTSVGVLSEAITGIAEDTEKNAAGIALAYALDAPGLSYGKRFAITGALGQFRGESAVGFSGSFKAGEFVLISVGGGFAGSGDSSVTGGKLSATYEW